MSYILDALRRADAERERSEAPGLHAQHLDATLPDDAMGDESRRGRWLIAAGAVALAAVLGWFFLRGSPPPPAAPVPMAVEHPPEPPAAPPRPSPAMPAPAVAAMPAPAAPTVAEQAAPTAVVTSLPPIPAAAAPVAAPPKPAAAPVAAAAPASAAPGASASAAVTALSARPAAPASAAAPEPRIPTQAELPDELRREIPPLVVGGAMYSPTPANRMLILNGQVAHEGDQPAPGLVLEQINLKTAVLRYKGQRFRIAY